MKRGLVVVTGASGAVGSQAVRVLLEAGYEVRATDSPGADPGDAQEAGASWVEADLEDAASAHRVLDGARGVVHTAELYDLGVSWEQLYAVNVLALDNLCQAAVEARVDRFVHLSTAEVYGLPNRTPIDEQTPAEPLNDYARTKQLGEEALWRAQRFKGLPATVLRAASVYGPRSQGLVANLMALYSLGRARQYDWLRTLGGGALSHHVHARDVAHAAHLLLLRGEAIGNTYNVADTTPVRWGELVQYVAELVGFQGGALPMLGPLGRVAAVVGEWMPSSQLIRVNRILTQDWEDMVGRSGLQTPLMPRLDRDLFGYFAGDMVCDVSALHKLGFKPTTPVTLSGVRDSFDWYMAQGWLPGVRDLEQG